MYHHRASKLKQANKSHKTGAHAAKRTVESVNLGKVNAAGGPGAASNSSGGPRRGVKSLASAVSAGKANRANHSKQLKEARRAETLGAKRAVGATGGPPKVVCIIGMGPSADRVGAAVALLSLADDAWSPGGSNGALWGSPLTLSFAAFRSRVTVLAPPRGGEVAPTGGPQPFLYDVSHTLAAARSADVVLAVVDMAGGQDAAVDAEGDLFMSALKATGMPTIVGVVQGLGGLSGKAAADARRWATRLLTTEFGSDTKVVEAEAGAREVRGSSSFTQPPAGALHLVRAVTSAAPRTVTWRSQRPYMLVNELRFIAGGEEGRPATSVPLSSASALGPVVAGQQGGASFEASPTGTLELYGYLRGRPLNVHQLIALPGGGAYQCESVTLVADPAASPQVGASGSRGGAAAAGGVRKGGPSAATAVLTDDAVANIVSVDSSASSSSSSSAVVSGPWADAVVYSDLLASLGAWEGKVRVSSGASMLPPQTLLPTASASAAGASAPTSTPTSSSTARLHAGAQPITLAVAEDAFREPLEVVAGGGGGGGSDDDDMDNDAEQTWPTEEEEAAAAAAAAAGVAAGRRRAIPRGVSAYQASWLPEEGDDEGDDDEEEGEEGQGDDVNVAAASASTGPAPSSRTGAAAAAPVQQPAGWDGVWNAADAAAQAGKLAARAERARIESLGGREKFQERRRRRKTEETEGAVGGAAAAATEEEEEGAGSDVDMDYDEVGDAPPPASSANGGGGGQPTTTLTAQRLSLATQQIMFPDEIDTPYEVPARERFAR